MHYLALFVAFLVEITLKPNFVVTNYTIEFLTIVYFIILFRTTHTVSVAVPSVLILIANFLNGKLIGLQSILLLVFVLMYHVFFASTKQRQKVHGSLKKIVPLNDSIVLFAVLFFLMTLLQTFVLYIYGYNVSIAWQVVYYFINILVFIVGLVCIS